MRDTVLEQYLAKMGFLRDDYIYAVSKKKMLIYLAFSVVCLLGVIKYMLQFDNGHFLEYRTWLFNSNVQFFS